MATGRAQQSGIGLGIVGDGKGWSGAATRSDGLANRSDKINRMRPQVFLNFAVEQKELGQVTFELFSDTTPRTAENFRQLCLGLARKSKKAQKVLGYKGCKIHRIVPDFCIQAGDFDFGNGKGGESIYGEHFDDENFERKHDKPFLLSMANSGPNTNGAQFFITSKALPHLDGKHVVFGEAMGGLDLLLKLEAYGTHSGAPKFECVISDCGEVAGTSAAKFRELTSKKSAPESLDTFGNPLPPGWVKKESRSKPGVFYYMEKESGKTQFEVPGNWGVDGGAGSGSLLAIKAGSKRGAPAGSSAAVGPDPKKVRYEDRACARDEIRILVFAKRHRDFFGKSNKSWRNPKINSTKEEALAQLQKLREKFANQLIGGGASALKAKWQNMSTLENDEDKKNWMLGPLKKGGLTSLGFEQELEDAAFALKRGEMSDEIEGFGCIRLVFRVE